MRKRRGSGGLGFLVTPVCVLVGVMALFTAMSNLQSGQGEESQKQLENSLRRAAVTCYATEGVYPPTLKYIQKNYGIQIDEERFNVFYDVFADNLMPNITVTVNEEADA